MRDAEQKRFDQTRIAFNDAVSGSYSKMEQAADDMRFAFVPGCQWDGSDTKQFNNRPKFENNTTAIAIQRIHGQYQRMEFGIKIIPNSDQATEEDADILTAKYRDDFIKSDGVEADSNAALESFTCGFGATLWTNKYEDEENPDQNAQYLCNEPIYSACTSVVFSANALRKDKGDAKKAWLLVRANKEAIEKEYGVSISPYPHVVGQYFDWSINDSRDVYVAHVWEVIERNLTEYRFDDGYLITTGDGIRDSDGNDVPREILNELKEISEYETIHKKVKIVEYSYQHGDGYLVKPQRTPFKRVPIIPRYGHYVVINGQEYYWGEVAHKRDPQRFDNMLYSALGQIASQNQVAIKEYLPAQVNRHARAHAEKDVENPPYLLTDAARTDGGSDVIGPIGSHEPPSIGSGLQAAIQINSGIKTQQEGTGQSTLPSNASAKAIQQVNERQDDRYQSLFQNQMFSIQAAARVYIPAAQEIYFSTPRNIRLIGRDGNYSMIDTLQESISADGQTYGPHKHSAPGKYEIQVKMDEAYKDKRERELQQAMQLLQFVDTSSEKGQMVLNQAILSTDSDATRDLRKIARYDNIDILLAKGIQVKPENQEEEQYIQQKMQQMQQPPQPTPEQQALIAQAQAEAQARTMEGQAAIQNEQNDAVKNQIAAQKLENDRAKLQIDAHKAGADIDLKTAQTLKTQVEAATTMANQMAGAHR